jgi:glyoxylase-like metal-dependent hydrolase (beta-lactamase superfamily II)
MYRTYIICALLVMGLAFLLPARAHELQPVKVADNVYAFIGDPGEPSSQNAGNTGNSGFIVGEDGVVVIDTGISYEHGRQMLAAIARLSDKPVRLVIITHADQEFLFGNAAFDEIGVPVLAQVKSLELMRQRCEHCLSNLNRLLGPQVMRGSRLVLPTRLVDTSTTITVAGLSLELLHFGWGSTPGDLAVFDPASGVLFAGALVSNQRIPDLRDSDFKGWLGALDQIESIPCRVVVPAYGPIVGPVGIERTRGYLQALDLEVQRLYQSGASLMEAVDAADLPAYRNWDMYPVVHRRNVLQRYLQLEVEELAR